MYVIGWAGWGSPPLKFSEVGIEWGEEAQQDAWGEEFVVTVAEWARLKYGCSKEERDW